MVSAYPEPPSRLWEYYKHVLADLGAEGIASESSSPGDYHQLLDCVIQLAYPVNAYCHPDRPVLVQMPGS